MCYTNRQYEKMVRQAAALDAKIRKLEKERAAILDDIKSDMGDVEKVETDAVKITFARIISNRFDTTAFKAAHNELYNEFTRPQETRRFTYSLI